MTPEQVSLELDRLAEQLEGDYPEIAMGLLVMSGALNAAGTGSLMRFANVANDFALSELAYLRSL